MRSHTPWPMPPRVPHARANAARRRRDQLGPGQGFLQTFITEWSRSSLGHFSHWAARNTKPYTDAACVCKQRKPSPDPLTLASACLAPVCGNCVDRAYKPDTMFPVLHLGCYYRGSAYSDQRDQMGRLYHFALQIQPKMRRYFPRQRVETFAGRSEEGVAYAGLLRPPDGGLRRRSELRDDLSGEVLRMLRLHSAQAKSKAELVPPCGIGWVCTENRYQYTKRVQWSKIESFPWMRAEHTYLHASAAPCVMRKADKGSRCRAITTFANTFAMDLAKPHVHALALQLLAKEPVNGHGGMPAAFVVCAKLGVLLTKLAGAAGYRSLLTRSLAMASNEASWLKTLKVSPDGSFEGLEEVRSLTGQGEIQNGGAVFVAHLLHLLHTFIGEPLTMQLIKEAWPASVVENETPSQATEP